MAILKKLDKLVLGSFIGPFLLTTAVVVFIFLTQYLTKYMDEFVGKDLGFSVFGRLIGYFSVNMTPVSLPLAVLLSALITFGNLGEHKEIVAIKSSGISLLRVIAPLFILVVMLTVGAFFFSDFVVTKANLKAYSLLYDIRQKKPSMELKEGVFYNGLPNYSIRVSSKDEKGETLYGLMIYDHSSGNGNTQLTIADSGRMYTILDDMYLKLDMYNGTVYDQGQAQKAGHVSYTRVAFDTAELVFDLSSFNLNRTPEELFSENRYMLSTSSITKKTDSTQREIKSIKDNFYTSLLPFYHYMLKVGNPNVDTSGIDTVAARFYSGINYDSISRDEQAKVLERAGNLARNSRGYISSYKERIRSLENEIRTYEVEKYRKYSQSLAILVMFLIGAPLGAIIKKGGLGIPVLISIIFFIIYYVLTLTGEKYAKEGVYSMPVGMFVPLLLLVPVGLFFLRQARNDAPLLEGGFYLDYVKDLIRRFRPKKKEVA